MLGTLTLAAGSAVAGWLLQHAYQHMRYSFYEREDAAMLAPGADPEQRRSWLAAIAPQISIQAVAPSTIDALAASGDIDAGLLPARAAGAYARRYNPTLAGEAYWIPAYLAAGLAGAAMSPAAAVAAVSSLAIAASDIRFRIVPIPHLAVLAASCVLAFCPTSAGAAITAAGMAPHLGRRRRRAAHRRRMGRRRLPHARMRARGHRRNADCADARAGARRRIPALHRVLAPDRSQDPAPMPLAPVISLALIASLAAGAIS